MSTIDCSELKSISIDGKEVGILKINNKQVYCGYTFKDVKLDLGSEFKILSIYDNKVSGYIDDEVNKILTMKSYDLNTGRLIKSLVHDYGADFSSGIPEIYEIKSYWLNTKLGNGFFYIVTYLVPQASGGNDAYFTDIYDLNNYVYNFPYTSVDRSRPRIAVYYSSKYFCYIIHRIVINGTVLRCCEWQEGLEYTYNYSYKKGDWSTYANTLTGISTGCSGEYVILTGTDLNDSSKEVVFYHGMSNLPVKVVRCGGTESSPIYSGTPVYWTSTKWVGNVSNSSYVKINYRTGYILLENGYLCRSDNATSVFGVQIPSGYKPILNGITDTYLSSYLYDDAIIYLYKESDNCIYKLQQGVLTQLGEANIQTGDSLLSYDKQYRADLATGKIYYFNHSLQNEEPPEPEPVITFQTLKLDLGADKRIVYISSTRVFSYSVEESNSTYTLTLYINSLSDGSLIASKVCPGTGAVQQVKSYGLNYFVCKREASSTTSNIYKVDVINDEVTDIGVVNNNAVIGYSSGTYTSGMTVTYFNGNTVTALGLGYSPIRTFTKNFSTDTNWTGYCTNIRRIIPGSQYASIQGVDKNNSNQTYYFHMYYDDGSSSAHHGSGVDPGFDIDVSPYWSSPDGKYGFEYCNNNTLRCVELSYANSSVSLAFSNQDCCPLIFGSYGASFAEMSVYLYRKSDNCIYRQSEFKYGMYKCERLGAVDNEVLLSQKLGDRFIMSADKNYWADTETGKIYYFPIL